MAVCWRMRLKKGEKDFSQPAWDRNEVGIWYGAWSVDDFQGAMSTSSSTSEIALKLNELPHQHTLGWEVSQNYVDTARRFIAKISMGDWIVLYLNVLQEIALAKVSGPPRVMENHP